LSADLFQLVGSNKSVAGCQVFHHQADDATSMVGLRNVPTKEIHNKKKEREPINQPLQTSSNLSTNFLAANSITTSSLQCLVIISKDGGIVKQDGRSVFLLFYLDDVQRGKKRRKTERKKKRRTSQLKKARGTWSRHNRAKTYSASILRSLSYKMKGMLDGRRFS